MVGEVVRWSDEWLEKLLDGWRGGWLEGWLEELLFGWMGGWRGC